MRPAALPYLIIALVGLASAGPAMAQGDTVTLAGHIVDKETRAPIAGAYMVIMETSHRGRSDDSGRYAFSGLTPGTYRLRALAIGYAATTWELRADASPRREYTLLMTPNPVVLDTVRVRAAQDNDWRSPAALEHRRASGNGHFLMREDIDSRQAVTVADLLQAIPGIVTMCRLGECRTVITQTGRGCVPEWYVDGFPAGLAGGPEFPSRFAEAIEVYLNTSDAPMEMQRTGQRCGVIAIWTRRQP
jgi:hypothetical protein